jgi:DNA primase large subunit
LAAYNARDVLTVLKEKCNMSYEQLRADEDIWRKFSEQITFNIDPKKKSGNNRVQAEDFIKVPFKDALSLVNQRQVFLHRGIAYVHIDNLASIARSQFRAKLMSELVMAYKHLSTILKDQRVG